MRYNSKLILLVREYKQLKQEDLSRITDIPRSTLSLIERGLRYDEGDFEKIAAALDFPVSFFEHYPVIHRLSKFYYRKRASFPAKLLQSLEAKLEILRASFVSLTSEIKINYQDVPAISTKKGGTPEQIAEKIRLYLGLGEDPIDNPINLVERLGIPVIYFDVDSDKFSGLTLQTDNNIPVIVLNKNLPNDHRKFTLFHELGHLVMHAPFTDEPCFYESYKDEDLENEANQFAGAFLMPRRSARNTFGHITYSRLTDLKMYWKVSKQSILYRAREIGVITPERFKNLYIELSRYGEMRKEGINVHIDEPMLIRKLVDAYKEHLRYDDLTIAKYVAKLSMTAFKDCFGLLESSLFTIITRESRNREEVA